MPDPKIRGMLLDKLLAGFAGNDPLPPIEIRAIASNSAEITPQSAFIALPACSATVSTSRSTRSRPGR